MDVLGGYMITSLELVEEAENKLNIAKEDPQAFGKEDIALSNYINARILFTLERIEDTMGYKKR